MVKPYTSFQSQAHVKQNLTEHAYCLLSCPDNSTLNVFLCQTIVTLHQGQHYRHEHVHASHALKSTGMPSVNAIA